MPSESCKRYQFTAKNRNLELGVRTRIMGIVNVTPDSFSDGGRFYSPDAAVEQCLALLDEGADLLDIGGESTRPGSQRVSPGEQIRRVLPVIERIRPATERMISVDTTDALVAEAALEAGADVVNDVSGFRLDPRLPEVVHEQKAGVVLMHCRGTPETMHLLPPSSDILKEVLDDLQVSVNKAYNSNIPRDRIILDPGIGFGKNGVENLRILNRLPWLRELDLPILVGASRKRFIGEILDVQVGDRVFGTAGACSLAVERGAHILRVHDVRHIRETIQVVDAIRAERIES